MGGTRSCQNCGIIIRLILDGPSDKSLAQAKYSCFYWMVKRSKGCDMSRRNMTVEIIRTKILVEENDA